LLLPHSDRNCKRLPKSLLRRADTAAGEFFEAAGLDGILPSVQFSNSPERTVCPVAGGAARE